MKYKVGDIVRILNKTVGRELSSISKYYKKGDIDTIIIFERASGGYVDFYRLSRSHGWHFTESDLEIADYQELLNRRYKK